MISRLELTAAAGDDRIADPPLQCFDRNVNVVGEVLRIERTADGGRWVAMFQHADDRVIILVFGNVDPFSDRVFVREKSIGHAPRARTPYRLACYPHRTINRPRPACGFSVAQGQAIRLDIRGSASDQASVNDDRDR
jgi:hypothetical protein